VKQRVFNEIKKLPEFKKDFKRLREKYRSLPDDLSNFIDTLLKAYHKLNIDYKRIEQIPGLGIEYPKIYKAKKFTCKALKGSGSRSGIRIIYAYYEDEDIVEFIEIYYKGDKENEDRDRIKRYYKK